jgi:predicted NAD-dependent protein-ADP-ribosyltransferase YbiA (DUF1768 family)
MDECLDIVCGLWGGQPFSYEGTHYKVQSTEFPTIGHVVQEPRVPIWCVAALGREKSMERARRWDGVIPQVIDDGAVRQPHLDEIAALRDTIADDADIVVEGTMSEHSPAAYAAAGATWWIESMWDAMSEHSPVTAAYDRLRQGPPE